MWGVAAAHERSCAAARSWWKSTSAPATKDHSYGDTQNAGVIPRRSLQLDEVLIMRCGCALVRRGASALAAHLR